MRFSSEFYETQTTLQLARSLLGQRLVRYVQKPPNTGAPSNSDQGASLRVAGLIVETEAYLARNDLASHSARGRGRSNASMYLPAGYTYVYPIHAKYCFNVVSGAAGSGSAVLIRALEPTEGISWMQQQRGLLEPRRLTTGPGCLCQSLKIDRRLDGLALFQNAECWIEATEKLNEMSFLMGRSKRIGISKNVDARYRFFVDRNRFVSGRRGDHSGSADRQLMHP